MADQKSRILTAALALTASANESVPALRRVPNGTVEKIVSRSMALTESLPFSVREHVALRDVSDFITISQKGHSNQRVARNVDLLPVGHPMVMRHTRMSEFAMRQARANWIASDPSIYNDEVRSLVASACAAKPGTFEHEYFTTRVMSLPQGMVPLRALVAAFGDGNSSAARSARAKLQRRDSEGRFAWMGGGMSALVKRLNGVFRLSGRLVAQGGAMPDGSTDTFDIETPDGKIRRVNAKASRGSKAYLGVDETPDGYSPTPAKYSSKDTVMDESSVVTVDAPSGFVKDSNYQGPGERFTDDAYDVIKFDPNDEDAPDPSIGKLDFNKPVYLVRREGAKPSAIDTVVQSWADVQEYIRLDEPTMDEEQGRTPSIVARLDDDQIQQVMDKIGDSDQNPEDVASELFADIFGGGKSKGPEKPQAVEFDAPDGAYVPEFPFVPVGREDQESTDYTDDPIELASRKDEFSDEDLITALKGGVMPADGVPATGMAQLPFEAGDEYVPAEAIYEALDARGLNAKDILDSIYKGEEAGAPEPIAELPEDVVPETPKPERPKGLPALLDGLSDEEKAQFEETGDYKSFLPQNDVFDTPAGYYEIWDTPFENTEENPDQDPLTLAQNYTAEDLKDALREALETGGDGYGSLLKKDEDGEDAKTTAPAEAIRDALQLQGEDTNDFITEVYNEGFEGQQEIAEPDAADMIEQISEDDPSINEEQPSAPEAEEPAAPKPKKPRTDVGPVKPTAKSRTGQYYTVKPNGEKDRSLQYTDEYIEHLFSTPADELTLSEISDLENIGNQVPAAVKPFVAGATKAALKTMIDRANGKASEPDESSFTGEKFVGKKGKAKPKAKIEKPTAEAPEAPQAVEPADDGTMPIPAEPHIAKVKTKELMPGDVTVKDNFVIEEVFVDDEALAATGKATYGMKVKGHYPGHESQATKIWDSEAEIEVYRNVEAPEAGDKPALSKPKLDKYKKSNGGKGLYKDPERGWYPSSKADQEEYEAALAEYEAQLAEAKAAWTPPEGLDSFETADNMISVDPENPILVVTVPGPDLKPGDIAFKKEKDFTEFFVVQSTEVSEDGKSILVTGFYPGHEVQQKAWKITTPITVMRGVKEADMPQPGDKPALERPKKGDPDIKAKYDEFNAAKKASGESWTPPAIDYNKEALEEPKFPKAASKLPPFTGAKMRELLDQANGDADKLAQLLQNEEVIYFDYETTGDKNWSAQKPIQVAAYKYKGGKLVDEYITFINPGQPLGEFYTEKDPADILKDSDGNPISDDFLAKQPSLDEVAGKLSEFIGPDGILVAHNAPFDTDVLLKHMEGAGLDLPGSGTIDTLALARAVYDADGYKLEEVATRLGLADANTDWHDAKADAAVLEGILFNLLAEMKFSGQGSQYLDYDGGFIAAAEDYKRYMAEKKEYNKKKADYETAKVVADLMAGKEEPVTPEDIVEKVENFDKVDPDTVGPNDPIPSSKIADPSEDKVVSIDGTPISNAWVDDNENTTDLGPVPVEEWQPGDFFEAKYGGWYEVESIEQDPSNPDRMAITAKFLKNGVKTVKYWIKYKAYKIRRSNDKITGDEPQILDPQPEPPSVPADSAAPEKVGDWMGMDVMKGADGVHYAKGISSGVVSQLRAGLLQPPALPFFAPLGGGDNVDTGEGYYFDSKGVRRWGKYGAAGALVRRKNADGQYEYLLAKRASHISTGGGTWAYPGGAHKDLADSQDKNATAVTEFKEEMGGNLSGLEPVAVHDNYLSPDWKYQTNIYEVAPGQMSDISPKDGENSKFSWFTADQIKQLAADGRLHPDFADAADDIFDIAEPGTPTPEAELEPEEAPSMASLEFPIDMSGWKKISGPAGSNAGGFYYDPKTGDEYYVKFPKSESHARNEVLASAFYEESGVKVGRVFLGKDANGNTVLISPIVDGSKPDFKSKYTDPEVLASAREGFAVDAWLNNYDAVGLEHDNMITVGNDVYRIDPGGALLYRAQGKDKKDQLTPEVTQIDTLRDPNINPQMASVFGDMTDDQVAETVKAVAKITPEKIDALVDAAFGDLEPENAQFLKERLKARREDLMKRFGITESDATPSSPAPTATETPESGETTALDNLDTEDPITDSAVDITPAAGPASPAVSDAIDSLLSGESSDAEEALSGSGDPEAKNLVSKIKKAKAVAASPDPEPLSNDEKVSEDQETSKIDDEIDGIDPSVSSESIDYTVYEHPDLIIEQIEAVYGTDSNNGDATWTVSSIEANGAKYQAVIVKNKDNTFSAIYRMIDPDGSIVDVDRYGTYHSFEALKNRLNFSVFPTLNKEVAATGADPKKMAKVFAKLAKNTYWHKTGKSKMDLRKVKMTHPTPDGLSEVQVGDRVWDSKTGKFGTVKTVFPLYNKKYGYTDYVSIKFDDGSVTNAPTTLRIWKAGEDNKLITEPAYVPEFFPNPNPDQSKGASSAPSALATKPAAPAKPKAPPKPTPKASESAPPAPETAPEPAPTPEATPAVVKAEATPEILDISDYNALVASGLLHGKKSEEMYSEFGADNYNDFKEAIQGQKVKTKDDKNLVPGNIVTGEDGSIGVVTKIDKTTSKMDVSWLYGAKAGTSDAGIDSKSTTSNEQYLRPTSAKLHFGVDVDTSIQESAKKYMADKIAKMTEAQKAAAEKKKAAAAAKKAADEAKAAAQKALVPGAGFDPVVIEEPADWTTSIDGTPSVAAVLDAIGKNAKAGNNGAHVLIDADKIEDMKIRMTKIKDLTGSIRTRLRFKLTEWAGSDLTSRLMSGDIPDGIKVVSVSDRIWLRKFKTSTNGGKLREEIDIWSDKDLDGTRMYVDPAHKGQTFRLELSDENGNIIGYADLHRSNKTTAPTPPGKSHGSMLNGSHQNKVDLYLNEDASPQDVERALSLLGIDPRPATEADMQGLVENKVLSMFGGLVDPSTNLSSEERIKMLEKIYADWGFTASDVKATVIDQNRGTIMFQMPREVAEKIALTANGKSVYHSWYTGFKSAQGVFDLIFGGNFNSAMMPTTARMDEGINKGGQSPDDDQHTWGADYIFFSPKSYDPNNYPDSGNGFAFDIVDLIQNMDWFSTSYDAFGNRTTDVSPLQGITNISQFMVRDAVPMSLVKKVNIPNGIKSELKQILQNAGITEWNGIPVDKLFGLTGY